MGRAIIGESPKERAGNKMDKIISRSSRREEQKRKEPSLIEQLKASFPETWKMEVEELRKEYEDPTYKERKKKAREQFAKDYYFEVPPYLRSDKAEKQFIERKMFQWMNTNK